MKLHNNFLIDGKLMGLNTLVIDAALLALQNRGSKETNAQMRK